MFDKILYAQIYIVILFIYFVQIKLTKNVYFYVLFFVFLDLDFFLMPNVKLNLFFT